MRILPLKKVKEFPQYKDKIQLPKDLEVFMNRQDSTNQMTSTNLSLGGKERFLEFRLGIEVFAVELLEVKEVVSPLELTKVPNSPPYSLGLLNLRGLVITVIDLAKKLNVPSSPEKESSAIIVLEIEGNWVGVYVDEILQVGHYDKSLLREVPETYQNEVSQHLKQIIQNGEKLILCLNLRQLFLKASKKKAA
jgi:purine-binding chemotaxis protein CheW